MGSYTGNHIFRVDKGFVAQVGHVLLLGGRSRTAQCVAMQLSVRHAWTVQHLISACETGDGACCSPISYGCVGSCQATPLPHVLAGGRCQGRQEPATEP